MKELEQSGSGTRETGSGVHETAVFRGDEPDCLVAAGLACPVCLAGDVDWSLALEPWDHRAECRCRECGHARAVALTPDQALRLSLRGRRAAEAAPAALSGLAMVV